MIDELIYSELAKSFADSGDFLIRGAASGFRNVAYPALIAPAWLAGSMESAYAFANGDQRRADGARGASGLPLGQAADDPGYALLAAVLVLLMPSLNYTGC